MDNALLEELFSTMPQDTESVIAASKAFIAAGAELQEKYALLAQEAQALREQVALQAEEIKKSERLAMLGKTAAGIAHEVRNPLGAIKLFLSLLKEDLKEQPSSLELVNEIEKSTTALDNVVSNILHFAKNSQPLMAPVNMHVLLQEEVEEIKKSRPNEAKFNLKLSGNPYIKGHESSLKQVISNLLINALQATANAGEITLEYSETDNGAAKLIVKDNGKGIPQKVIERIFEPFVSTKNEGTGLGLAIVKRILDQHNATISVTNCDGACFTIVFPRNNVE